jgi:Lon protease-like protein
MTESRNDREHLREKLQRLPIFPLYRVLLFPRALLPLYVFEPRYREMTAACLAGDGLLAIAQLKPGFESEYQGRPPVRSMASLGKIIAHRQNPDGTYNILLEGIGRVRIDEELPPEHSFREVRAHLVRDRVTAALDEATVIGTLRLLIDKLAKTLGDSGASLRTLVQETKRLPCLVDVLSSALVQKPGMRRRLFECRDVAVRAELLTVSLARLVAGLNSEGHSELN